MRPLASTCQFFRPPGRVQINPSRKPKTQKRVSSSTAGFPLEDFTLARGRMNCLTRSAREIGRKLKAARLKWRSENGNAAATSLAPRSRKRYRDGSCLYLAAFLSPLKGLDMRSAPTRLETLLAVCVFCAPKPPPRVDLGALLLALSRYEADGLSAAEASIARWKTSSAHPCQSRKHVGTGDPPL